MSTTPPAEPSPSTSPSSSPPNTDASTLLFGFLVSALSIFAVFMTSAIIWNRLVARRLAIEAMLTTSSPDSPRVCRPMMWDILIKPDKQPPPSWSGIKPVAAQECDFPPSSSRTTRTEQTIPFWRRHPLNRLPPEIRYLFHKPIPPAPSASSDSAAPQVELRHGSDIQVSLLIAMPHAPQSTRTGAQGSHHMLHEMVFATTNVLYHDPTSS